MPANIKAVNRYQPSIVVTNVNAPPAVSKVDAISDWPFAVYQNAPAMQPNAGGRGRRIRKKTTLVRREQMR